MHQEARLLAFLGECAPHNVVAQHHDGADRQLAGLQALSSNGERFAHPTLVRARIHPRILAQPRVPREAVCTETPSSRATVKSVTTPRFEVICETEPPTRADLIHVRHQIGVPSKVSSTVLISNNQLDGRRTYATK